MKTELQNQTGLEIKGNDNLNQNHKALQRAVMAEIEYDNGTSGEIINFFNNDVDFELIVQGMIFALRKQDNVKAVTLTVCCVENEILQPWAKYQRKEFSYDEKVEATNGSHIFYHKSKVRAELQKIMKENNISHDHRSEYPYSQ